VEGPLGERGPVPQRERSALMITEVAHGSFGFVLEGAERTAVQELPVTSLREVVDEVCDLINGVAGPDDADIDDPDGAMPDVVDKRVLADLQAFFRLLHDAGATLRIVGDRREFSLRRDTIARAKMRSEAMCVKESTERVRGRLYVLPEARRFELHVLEGGLSLRGSVSAEAMQAIVEDDGEIQADLIGNVVKATMQVRELRLQQQQPGRRSYRLIRIEADGDDGSSLDQVGA
jgi:hypothetical protein